MSLNQKTSKLSVLISLYDGEIADYFSLAMESLVVQTLPAEEVVLVIDGPVRLELENAIIYWSDKLPLKLVRLNVNQGLARALNIGLKHCTHDLVARMDTDDLSHSYRFKQQVEFMTNHCDVDICGAYCDVISESGDKYDKLTVPTEHDEIKRLIWSCPMIHPSVMFKKEKILKIGGYSETAPRRQDDYELWIRAVSSGLVFANISMELISYRLARSSKTKNSLDVAWNRAKIGFSAVNSYDRRVFAYLALCYPMFRAIIPNVIFNIIRPLINLFDPRR
ncbi:glycosyltransferase [Vibrio sp. ZSDE26]|uniref:Glycosyltransferase n=1 Tax=Vibrio amylolyticus TaxID=2847292 RepID=A0A9X2BHQ0_9VIBR|nr:glycosyltransferase [Vibrio amylolyticus]MCK6263240.1 glycosyltransferase [Vibrio amylolyticus]